MDFAQLPLVPIGAFFIATGLFGYQLYAYFRFKKKQIKPSIPNFPTQNKTPQPEALMETVALSSQNTAPKQTKKKQSYALYYAVVGFAIIGIGMIAFSLFSQQKFTYVPRASDGITPTSPIITTTAAPTPTPLVVLSITPSSKAPTSGVPTLTLAPTTVAATATPTIAPTIKPTISVAPTNTPFPSSYKAPLTTLTPTKILIAKTITETPTIAPTIAPTSTPIITKASGASISTTPQKVEKIPETSLFVWPALLVVVGGGLLILGLVF